MEKKSILQLVNYFMNQGILSKKYFATGQLFYVSGDAKQKVSPNKKWYGVWVRTTQNFFYVAPLWFPLSLSIGILSKQGTIKSGYNIIN